MSKYKILPADYQLEFMAQMTSSPQLMTGRFLAKLCLSEPLVFFRTEAFFLMTVVICLTTATKKL